MIRLLVGLALGFFVGEASLAVAQAVSPGATPPLATDVWSTLVTSGPLATLLGFILWRVDSERRQLQSERDALLERVLTGLAGATQSTKDVATTATTLLQTLQTLTESVRSREH